MWSTCLNTNFTKLQNIHCLFQLFNFLLWPWYSNNKQIIAPYMNHCQPVKSKYFANSVLIIIVLTSQKAWIVDRPRIVHLISSPVHIPCIISNKLFPLFKPVTVNKIPWKTTNKSCFSHCWLIIVKDAISGMSHKCNNCCNIYLEGHAHISQRKFQLPAI